jgi:hypothetical protein
MKRTFFTVMSVLAVSMALLLPGTQSASGAARPAYAAVLGNSSSCQFGLTATWPPTAHVATVYAQWYFNGTPPAPNGTFEFTMQAPGTGPNAGTITHRAANFTAGPLYPSSATYSWYVLVQYYNAAGAQLASIYSNVDTTTCANQPGL